MRRIKELDGSRGTLVRLACIPKRQEQKIDETIDSILSMMKRFLKIFSRRRRATETTESGDYVGELLMQT